MNGVAKAQAEQRQLGSLKRELARIGALIEEGKLRLEGFEFDAAEEERLRTIALPELRKQEKDLAESVARLKSEEVEARRSHDKETTKRTKVIEAYQTTSDHHQHASNKKSVIERQVSVLKEDKESISASIKESGRQIRSARSREIDAANAELAGIRTQIRTAQQDLASMDSKRKQSKKLTESIAANKKRLNEIESDIAQKARILEKKSVEVDALDEKLAEKKRSHDAECAKSLSAIDEEKKDLSRREGRVNRTVQWIKDRAAKLSQAKREIEDFRGKDLSHIIIPDVSDLE